MLQSLCGWRESVSYLARAGRDLLFPPRCLLCDTDLSPDRHVVPLCPNCAGRLGPERWSGCRRCGAQTDTDNLLLGRCPACRKSTLWFDTVVALGNYHAGLRDAVVRMKRSTHHTLSIAVGRLLADRRRRELAELRADFVVPIPMYWMRWLARGMNSPELLGGCVSRVLQIPMRRLALVRQRNTLPQKDLRPAERFRNMEGAFRVRRGADVHDMRVLLVDDILTTGATCSEAAKVLKQAGAAMVAVAVAARTQGN